MIREKRGYEDPEYIKMCDCPEIQDNWKPEEDDLYIYVRFLPLDKSIYLYNTRKLSPEEIKEATWLPRQDQLQEMIDGDFNITFGNFYRFASAEKEDNDEVLKYESYEQLWLAFVMKEKHDKTWHKDEWVYTPYTDKEWCESELYK